MNNKTQYDSDETVELPPDTLAILNEFLQSRIEKKSDDFEEDWVSISNTSLFVIH